MQLEFFTLDVFTDRKFGGNPLAVVLEADPLSTEQMQTIAREFNLSETIFVMKPEDPANTAKVRIFFPTAEIPFAGHPTVGCAILLAERKNKPGCNFETEIRLEEVAGLVPVKVSRIGERSRAMFTAPVIPHAIKGEIPNPALAARALSIDEGAIGFDRHRIGLWKGGPAYLYVPLNSRKILAACRVSEPAWSQMIEAAGVDSVFVYARGCDGENAHFRARMFAPTAGIPEDPATGSATAILAAQLLASGELAEGTTRLRLEQGYEMGRPADLMLEVDVANQAIKAVRVAGGAVRVMQGKLEL